MLEFSLFGNTFNAEVLDDFLSRKRFYKKDYNRNDHIFKDGRKNILVYRREKDIFTNKTKKYLICREKPDANTTRRSIVHNTKISEIVENSLILDEKISNLESCCGFKKQVSMNINLSVYTNDVFFIELSRKDDEDCYFIRSYTLNDDLEQGELMIEKLKNMLKDIIELKKPSVKWFYR